MSKLLTISPSPHVHTSDSVNKIMYRVILALVPALAWSVFMFGFEAIRVTLLAVAACVAFEYLIQKYIMKSEPQITDGSAALTGILLAFNVPASLPTWMILVGALVAIGVGKLSFGGLGNNPFNPALVGRVFLLISFPVQMTSWPVTQHATVDALTTATPLALLKEGVKAGQPVSEVMQGLPANLDLLYGNMPGSLGEISALFLLLGFAYMLWKKVITWHIPVFILGTIFAFQGILWMFNPENFIEPVFHLLTGGAMLGAIYMATDMVTSPMTVKGQLIYGIGIGVITVLIRNFGAYPEGISFAILIMNGFTPLLNVYIKPKRFGGTK
ncbi:RnfABCDGE type electron transport complex subunit D [Sunxiuqinia elliptica]|uniref:Ion-translocating oxidoreductase complex subunit D n=1 Tax=Sunxiuqinia elliptica TaxID=655355 RepID=A0A1I2H5W8_9BACT|nr:RnfABCDGE type electron transport complex subunit D [Sunxiuqinia elliptica]TDN99860.1 electron transport complex protein RnfD [Sunxiuqinia elliptica]TDO57052.1 electron transport complex protein RnfD [Sunxiuqinia elliptica]SFF24377.1 electron transport complex protein RnfD [Sunxiuqinia elliptica]